MYIYYAAWQKISVGCRGQLHFNSTKTITLSLPRQLIVMVLPQNRCAFKNTISSSDKAITLLLNEEENRNYYSLKNLRKVEWLGPLNFYSKEKYDKKERERFKKEQYT